jgi:ABC-2 type transport system ATP-binding protein
MRVLTCFLKATSGKVTIAGHDVLNESIAVRQKIGYLPESAPLYMDMRVDDYLKFIGRARGVSKSTYMGRLEHVVSSCGVAPVLKKSISELSKGFKQRVGLAQAMIHDPEILILDEPTSGLDPIQILEIRNLIQEIGKEKTVILSTHILQEVSAVCSRIIIINNGHLIADGALDSLRKEISHHNRAVFTINGPRESVLTSLKEIEGVQKVRFAEREEGGAVHYEVHTKPDRTADEDIMKLCMGKGWQVVAVQHPEISLEEVFISFVERDNQNRGIKAA